MEWSHASLDQVGHRSSRKRAVEASPSSQPSVNFVPSVVQCDPQGNPPSVDDMFSADPYANRFLYTGREFLKEANLYDYRNRVYSAELGRFLQSDPIRFDAGDGNIYRYVFNSPTMQLDSMGLGFWSDLGNWFKDVFSYVVPGSEFTGGAQATPGIASLAIIKAAEKAYQDCIADPPPCGCDKEFEEMERVKGGAQW
jgi:RHS repeat-associated protein